VELPLKTWDEDDVEIQITDSGICGSDVHTLDSNWGPTLYPAVVGHEIAGIVTKVGQNVTKVKVGDRAGVGPICYACGQCDSCLNGKPNVCAKGIITTYNSRYGKISSKLNELKIINNVTANGDKTYGGYADIWRYFFYPVLK
jgi:D-arabinose 1-dehydrogenase-like Zn-dependent alcohol dehydrogenase